VQAQSAPHVQRASDLQGCAAAIGARADPHAQMDGVAVQAKGLAVRSSVIGTSWVSGFDDRCLAPPGTPALERSGYVIRKAAGVTPNMRRNVRLRCAESENPASCAAWVRDAPAAKRATARVSRSHST
jgi:hypothetical protein